MKSRILALCFTLVFGLVATPSFGSTTKAGGVCLQLGVKSGSLICVKGTSGKLKWQIVKKTQKISYSAPSEASILEKSLKISYSASSKLKPTLLSLTPTLCSLGSGQIVLSGAAGICRVSVSQKGNASFLAAKSVSIEVRIIGANFIDFHLPGALLLNQATFQLLATSSSNLPIDFSTSTPSICTVMGSTLNLVASGACTVMASHSGSGLVPAADSVIQSTEISAGRVTADLPDSTSGFQVKAIYVVPSDGTDNSYDINGYLAGVLDEGNRYLGSQIGLTVPIDRSTAGYDIQYLKSKFSTEYLRTHASASSKSLTDSYLLLNEIKAMENPGDSRKDYIFFIDVPGFDNAYCGMADKPGIAAVVALQNISASNLCSGKSTAFSYNSVVKTWVHELFHNFGVSHTPDDPCDLMAGSPETPGTCASGIKFTIDKERTRYVGASTQGQDITKLRVWQGYTDNMSRQADCLLNPIPRADGIPYAYCPTGTQAIGALTYCWGSIGSVSLEEDVKGVWVSLGAGNHRIEPWGSRVTWKCTDPNYSAPWKELTVDTAGLRHYRWIVDGRVSEDLNVIWVK